MTDMPDEPSTILRDAIAMEVQGAEFYGRAAERMRNQKGKDMFQSLVKQERLHADILGDQLRKYAHDRAWLSLDELRGRARSRGRTVFDDPEVKRIVVGPDAGELEVITMGMEIEKKSVEFYRDASRSIIDKNARKMFNWLIAQEAGHLTILQAEYDYRTRSGFYMGDPEFSLEVM